jgi:predicted aconitase
LREITAQAVFAEGVEIPVQARAESLLQLTGHDRAMLAGEKGEAVSQARRILVAMARQQGAVELTDVSRAHIDGCIYAGPANRGVGSNR